MSFQTTLALLLVAHIIGLTMMVGGVLASFALNRGIHKSIYTDTARALTLMDGARILAPIIGLGAMLLIVSGTIMTIQLKSIVTQALWFRVKMPLIVVLILLQTLVGRPAMVKMGKLLAQGSKAQTVIPLNARVRVTYLIQLFILTGIFVLSIFKF
jgi:hypothetical protein